MPGRRWASASAAADPAGRCAGAAALALDRSAQRGADLLTERLDLARVVGAEDERAETVFEHEGQKLLHPVVHGRRHHADVQQSPDLARVAAGGDRRFVDRLVRRRDTDPASVDVGEAREPAVGRSGEEAQPSRLVHADPDRDVVGRLGPAFGADDAVVLALDADVPVRVDIPHLAQDLDRLAEGFDALAGCAARTAHRDDAVPEPARADADADAPAGEQVEGGGGARGDGRIAQRKVQDVRREIDASGGSGEIREERPGVLVCGLVRVVLERHQIEPRLLAELCERDDVLRTPALRGEERS